MCLWPNKENAAFIAASRQAVPELVAEVRRLKRGDFAAEEIRRLQSLMAERWPDLNHQCRDRLFVLCQRVGVIRDDQWLSEACIEAITKLQGQVASLTERVAAQSELLGRKAEKRP